MYHRYAYGSFAEYSEEYIRGNHRGPLINARVVGISRERICLVWNHKIHCARSCDVRKVKRRQHNRRNGLLTLDSSVFIVICY